MGSAMGLLMGSLMGSAMGSLMGSLMGSAMGPLMGSLMGSVWVPNGVPLRAEQWGQRCGRAMATPRPTPGRCGAELQPRSPIGMRAVVGRSAAGRVGAPQGSRYGAPLRCGERG